jgi:hypothetical protein
LLSVAMDSPIVLAEWGRSTVNSGSIFRPTPRRSGVKVSPAIDKIKSILSMAPIERAYD